MSRRIRVVCIRSSAPQEAIGETDAIVILCALYAFLGMGCHVPHDDCHRASTTALANGLRAIEEVRAQYEQGTAETNINYYVELVQRDILKEQLLKSRFGRVISCEDLSTELGRIDRESEMPEAWAQMKRVLGDDPVLIKETACRRALVQRLLQESFDRDLRIQSMVFAQAEEDRRVLMAGGGEDLQGYFPPTQLCGQTADPSDLVDPEGECHGFGGQIALQAIKQFGSAPSPVTGPLIDEWGIYIFRKVHGYRIQMVDGVALPRIGLEAWIDTQVKIVLPSMQKPTS